MKQKVPVLTADYRGQILETVKGAAAAALPAARGYWPLDGDLVDASGNGFDMANVSGSAFAAGLYGQAYSAGQAQVANQALLSCDTGDGPFTLSEWVYIPTAITSGPSIWILTLSPNDGLQWPSFGTAQNSNPIWWQNGVSTTRTSCQILRDVWNHLALRVGDGFASIFVNGYPSQPLPVPTGRVFNASQFFRLVAGPAGTLLDDLAVWRLALSDDQVRSITDHTGPLSDLLP